MSTSPPPLPGPPTSEGPLPPKLAQIWDTFARAELGRGRRDISNLVEVTLQFVLERESRNLSPLVATLAQLERWQEALSAEVKVLGKRLTATPEGDISPAYQRINIVLDKGSAPTPTAADSPSMRRVPVGAPTAVRAELGDHLAQLRRQQEALVEATGKHVATLQQRRGELATRLRHYSSQMHQIAEAMVAEMPEASPGLRPTLPTGLRAGATPPAPAVGAAAATATAEDPSLPRWRRWLGGTDPRQLLRTCVQALMQGYRSRPQALPPAAPTAAEPEASPPTSKDPPPADS